MDFLLVAKASGFLFFTLDMHAGGCSKIASYLWVFGEKDKSPKMLLLDLLSSMF